VPTLWSIDEDRVRGRLAEMAPRCLGDLHRRAAGKEANPMTCLLGIVTPSIGAWMASDHRLVWLPSGELITDTSVKHVGMRTKNGSALLTYTGFGRVGDEDISDWVRTTLRGENRTLEETADLIAGRASARFGATAHRAKLLHVFVMAAFSGDTAFVATIANTTTPFGVASPTLRRDFVVAPMRIDGPFRLYGGAGGLAVSPADRELLTRASEKRPRDPEDFLGLLAAVNRRTATSRRPGSEMMSPGCVVSYLPPADDATVATKIFGDDGDEKKIPWPPFLLFGVDATELMRAMVFRPGQPPNVVDWEGAARRSVEPRTRR
jgi:hypothetical protein